MSKYTDAAHKRLHVHRAPLAPVALASPSQGVLVYGWNFVLSQTWVFGSFSPRNTELGFHLLPAHPLRHTLGSSLRYNALVQGEKIPKIIQRIDRKPPIPGARAMA